MQITIITFVVRRLTVSKKKELKARQIVKHSYNAERALILEDEKILKLYAICKVRSQHVDCRRAENLSERIE